MSKTNNSLVSNWTRRAFVKTSTTAAASVLLPMGFGQRAFAQTAYDFYISPTGSDNNSGTQSSPWAITSLNTRRSTYAGRRVGLLDGTYSTAGMAAYNGGYSPSLGIAGGSAASPTVIEAVNPRMAIIDGGRSTDRAAIGSFDNQTAHITLKDVVVRNCTKSGIHIQGPVGQAAGIRIEGCDIGVQVFGVGDITSGIFLQSCDDAIITNNYLHDISNTAQSSSVASILMYGCRRTEIVANSFASTVHTAIHDKYAGGTQGSRIDMQETRVRRNHFLGCANALWGFDNKDQTGTPPNAAPYGPYIIENNVFENCGAALTNPGAFSSASPMIVRNNTVYMTSGSRQGFNLHALNAGARPSFYNNIIYFSGASWGETRALVLSVDGNGSALAELLDYNCYGPGAVQWLTQTGYGYPYSNGGSNYVARTTAAAWQSATGGDRAGRSLFAIDPQFAMTGNGAERFQLRSGSPCLNAGRVGGVSSGAACHLGAWDGRITRIGSYFGAVPKAPVVTSTS